MKPAELVMIWIDAFNIGDVDILESLYHDDAINHQIPNVAVIGKHAIAEMFRNEFKRAPEMNCIPVQVIEEGNWAVLEWRDPRNFRGCGFFEVIDNKIKTQRGYWDKLSFIKIYDVQK